MLTPMFKRNDVFDCDISNAAQHQNNYKMICFHFNRV